MKSIVKVYNSNHLHLLPIRYSVVIPLDKSIKHHRQQCLQRSFPPHTLKHRVLCEANIKLEERHMTARTNDFSRSYNCTCFVSAIKKHKQTINQLNIETFHSLVTLLYKILFHADTVTRNYKLQDCLWLQSLCGFLKCREPRQTPSAGHGPTFTGFLGDSELVI